MVLCFLNYEKIFFNLNNHSTQMNVGLTLCLSAKERLLKEELQTAVTFSGNFFLSPINHMDTVIAPPLVKVSYNLSFQNLGNSIL